MTIYQVDMDGILFQNKEGIKELKDDVVYHCLHARIREPHLTDFVKIDEDDNEEKLSLSTLRNEVDYEIECGWY